MQQACTLTSVPLTSLHLLQGLDSSWTRAGGGPSPQLLRLLTSTADYTLVLLRTLELMAGKHELADDGEHGRCSGSSAGAVGLLSHRLLRPLTGQPPSSVHALCRRDAAAVFGGQRYERDPPGRQVLLRSGVFTLV